MKNLKSILGAGILAGSLVLGGNAYAQKIEKTEYGFNQYNEKGQIVQRVEQEPGHYKLCYDYEYDSQGKESKIIFKSDSGDDGKFDFLRQEIYKYDKQGEHFQTICKEDKENDGKFDYLLEMNYKYNKKGQHSQTIYKMDNENDGKIDYIEIDNYTYDEERRPIKIEIFQDFNADGKIDNITYSFPLNYSPSDPPILFPYFPSNYIPLK